MWVKTRTTQTAAIAGGLQQRESTGSRGRSADPDQGSADPDLGTFRRRGDVRHARRCAATARPAAASQQEARTQCFAAGIEHDLETEGVQD